MRRRQLGYELIAGARGFAAATAAGLTELPCRVYNVGEQEALALAEADDLRLRGEIDRPPPIAPPHATLGPALLPRLALPAECHGPDLPLQP